MPQVVAVEQLQFIFDLIYYFLTPPISLLFFFLITLLTSGLNLYFPNPDPVSLRIYIIYVLFFVLISHYVPATRCKYRLANYTNHTPFSWVASFFLFLFLNKKITFHSTKHHKAISCNLYQLLLSILFEV